MNPGQLETFANEIYQSARPKVVCNNPFRLQGILVEYQTEKYRLNLLQLFIYLYCTCVKYRHQDINTELTPNVLIDHVFILFFYKQLCQILRSIHKSPSNRRKPIHSVLDPCTRCSDYAGIQYSHIFFFTKNL